MSTILIIIFCLLNISFYVCLVFYFKSVYECGKANTIKEHNDKYRFLYFDKENAEKIVQREFLSGMERVGKRQTEEGYEIRFCHLDINCCHDCDDCIMRELNKKLCHANNQCPRI